jgi:hypothetical protein
MRASPREPKSERDPAVEAEAWVLTTELGRRLLDLVAGVRSPGPAEVERFRKLGSPPAVAAAIRISQARKKAAAKFKQAARMWVDPLGVEQATAEVVARHKAARFTCNVVVDLCAGIGGDALALAKRSDVLAVDLDQGMCRRLQYNAAIHGVGSRVMPVRARAESFAIPPDAWLHLDPDRRRSPAARARALDGYAPGPSFWKRAARQVRAGAIKLSPASDFSKHLSGPEYEVELISLHGECKEATVWFGELASCGRRATRLPENVTWTDRDGPANKPVGVSPLASFIYDPDPALLRSGLLDEFAQTHDLRRAAAGVDYLTSEHLVRTPFLAAFQVQEVLPMDLKHLRGMLARREIGTLEIKVRGADIAPETLRGRLALRGSRAATLLVVGGRGAVTAVLAQRASTGRSTASSTGGAADERDSVGAGAAGPLPLLPPPPASA